MLFVREFDARRSLGALVKESVTKLVPSAEADSVCPTFASRHCRGGLSHAAASRLE